MSKYNEEYFFIRNPRNREDIISLSPDNNTVNRRYDHEQEDEGSPPLFFLNGAKDFQKSNNITAIMPDGVLFDGSNFIIDTSIRNELFKLNIPNMHTHHAVYMHDDGTWYEDYWYITFEKHLDCWDREKSEYFPESINIKGIEHYEVLEYSLDDNQLNQIALNDRLLFKLGGVMDTGITCHESIKYLFDRKGVELIAISDF